MDSYCIRETNSDDYIDLIYREGALARRNFDLLADYCVIPVNSKWSIIAVNRKYIEGELADFTGISTIPGIYGLSDMGAVNSAGILSVREQPFLGLYGNGVVIAIIDTGINWRHEAFVNEDNTTKIIELWDQESGRVYTSEDINRALAENLDDIPTDENGHGTFMAGIAAGRTNMENGFSGAAPQARLLVVKLKQAKKYLRDYYFVKDGVPAYSEADIMRGVAYVNQVAEDNAFVVSYCISLGTSLTNHAGTTPLCDILSDEAGKTGRCVTVATGNQGNERLHYSGRVTSDQPERVEIRVGQNENGFSCQLWSMPPEVYSVEIISPTGQIINRIPARIGITTRLNFIFENTTVLIFYRQYETLSGQNVISIRFDKPSAGIWILNVYGSNLTTGMYNIWIMNREFISENTYFIRSDPYITITDPANISDVISVSAYDYKNNSFFLKNGRGYNINDVIKPDFCTPGVELTGPSERGTNTYVTRSGSSVAAAFYAGMGALIEEYGIVKGRIPYIGTSEIKNITISGCIRNDGIVYPSREWGFGVANIYNSLEILRNE